MASSDVTLRMLLTGEDRSASKALKGAGRAAEETGKKTKVAGAMMAGALGADVIMQASTAIIDFGKESINAFAELDDSTAAAGVIFGKNMNSIIKQADTANSKLGMSKQQVIDAANTFGTYGKAAGLGGKDLAGFSTKMTALAGDMASFKGTSPEQAIEAIGAALRGETEPIRAYGVMLDDASLRQQALKMGLIKTTKDALTPQQKSLAAQALILKQTKDAQGDFARTADSTSNVMKTQQAKFEDLQATIGSKLAPVMTAMLDIGNKVIDWISQNVDWLGPLALGLGVSAAAFAALNVVMAANPIGLIVVAIGALVGGLIWCYNNVKWFKDGVDTAFKAIGDIARWLWNNALAPMIRFILNGFAWVIDGIANMLDALGNVPGFGWAKDAAKNLRGLAKGARDAADNIKPIADPALKGTAAVNKLDKSIKGLKSKIVTAKAKGDDKELKKLEKQLKAAEAKKHRIGVTIAAQLQNDHIKLNIERGGKTAVMRMYAGGGRPKVGEPAIVGENGWEVFVPDTAGRILNQRQLVASGSSSVAAASGGGGVINLTINALDPRGVGPLVVKALDEHSRATGGRGFNIRKGVVTA